MNNSSIKAQAKKAYEMSRLKMAAAFGLIVLPLTILSCITCGSDTLPLIVGTVLLFSVVIFKWRGLEYGKSVTSGLIAGGVAFSIPLVMHLLEICCRNNLEVVFCVASGIIGGILLGRLMRFENKNRLKILVFSLFIAGLTSTLGCASLGVSALVGLLASMGISALISSRLSNQSE